MFDKVQALVNICQLKRIVTKKNLIASFLNAMSCQERSKLDSIHFEVFTQKVDCLRKKEIN